MNCEEVRRRILDRALEELPTEESHSIEAHLRSCAACAQAWEEIAATHGLLSRHLVQAEVPRQFRLVATEAPRRSWPEVWLPALRYGLSAGLALVLLVASLALAGANFTRENGNLRIAFGRERVVAPAGGVSRAEINELVEARLREAETRLATQQQEQVGRLAAELKLASASDVRKIGERLELLQSAQNQMWKEAQRSQYLVQLVASSALARPSEAPK